jgi:predicted ferric reductase
VTHVVTEAPGVISIYMAGRDLDQLAVRSGQYFVWRFLTRDGWWRGHPFSISSAPNGQWLRITIKELGDWSKALQSVSVGTRVFIEGPYGVLTGARRTRPRILLVAGGIGITPLRALLEALPAKRGEMTLIYRVRDTDDIIFRDELETLAHARGAPIHYLLGRRDAGGGDSLDAESLQRLVPDVRERDVYLCGPVPMMQRVEDSLRRLGLPVRQIHAERFAY